MDAPRRTRRTHGQPVSAAEDYLALMEERIQRLPPLVPVTDVALTLGVCRQTIYNLLEGGELAGLRLAGRRCLRVFRQSVLDYVRRQVT